MYDHVAHTNQQSMASCLFHVALGNSPVREPVDPQIVKAVTDI